MQEKLVPIEIPPGIVKNGTMYQRAGRWADGNLVRFGEDGSPRAVGGAVEISTTGPALDGTPAGVFVTVDGSGNPRLVIATSSKVFTADYDGTAGPYTLADHTPTGWSPGVVTFGDMPGVGPVICDGAEVFTSATEPWGTLTLVSTGSVIERIAITPENFLVGLQGGRVVKWASQGTVDTWVGASTNTAGGLTLPGDGEWVGIKTLGNKTLIWSDDELWALQYVGGALVYGAARVHKGAGLIAAHAAAADTNTAYWMTDHGFYRYDGYAQPLRCDIADEIYGNMNAAYRAKIFAIRVFDEIWWFWPSFGGTGLDRVAIYNTRLDVWSRGELSRSVGVSAGAWPGQFVNAGATDTVPVMLDAAGTTIYGHEATGVSSGAYIESGPVLLDDAGNKKMRVQKWVADNNQTTTAENLTLYTGEWPKQAESNVVYSIPAIGGEIDVRVTGRYLRFKQELTRVDSRVGTPRMGLVPDSAR